MHLEVLRMMVDALSDPATGIEAQLNSIPKDAEDLNVTITPPVKYLDPTRDEQAALKGEQLDFPVIVVSADEPAVADGMIHTMNVHHRQADHMPISVRYITREMDSADGVRDALYCERAILRALYQWLKLDGGDSKRMRNGVTVVSCPNLRYAPVDQLIPREGTDPLQVLMAIRLELTVRDTLP